MRLLNRGITALMFVIPVVFSVSSFAEDVAEDWYQIEAILFEHTQSDLEILRHEHPEKLMPSQRKDFLTYYELGKPLSDRHIAPLEDAQRDLLEAYNRLMLDPLTRPVFYYAWKQKLPRNEELLPVRIFEGPQSGPFAMFEGYLHLRRNRYTHVAIDVFKNDFLHLPYDTLARWLLEDEFERWPLGWLVQPLALQNGALATKGFSYLPQNTLRLSQSRRVKDGETHYIDHPAMGLIVTIKSIASPHSLALDYTDPP